MQFNLVELVRDSDSGPLLWHVIDYQNPGFWLDSFATLEESLAWCQSNDHRIVSARNVDSQSDPTMTNAYVGVERFFSPFGSDKLLWRAYRIIDNVSVSFCNTRDQALAYCQANGYQVVAEAY